MQRRGFLGAVLAAGVAPAAIGSGILMPVKKIVLVDPFGQFGFAEVVVEGKMLKFRRFDPMFHILPFVALERRVIA